VTRLGEVDPAAWDALVPGDNPFLEHRFLHGLETSGAVGRGTGWQPCHVLLEDDGQVVAAMPLYARGDSYGEYVFDWGWASAASRAGLRYYPKLTTAVPYTPSSTGRVLGDPARLAPAVELLRRETGASGHHVLFCSPAEAGRLADLGYAPRLGFQFQWRDEGFGDFAGFLGRLNHKRRKELLRERRQVREAGILIQVVRGSDVSRDDISTLYGYYRDTIAKHGQHPYLVERWWREVLPALGDRLLVVMAYRHGERVAGALNFVRGAALYGRYWGCSEDFKGLHFEVCYHALVEWALQNGVSLVEAGAQGEHKLQRGFLPRLTYSAHRLAHGGLHDAVSRFCAEEAEQVRRAVAEYAAHGPFALGRGEDAGPGMA